MRETKIIAISGGSGSGKSTLAKKINDSLGPHCSEIIFQDSYYIDQSDRFDGDGGSVNFDHPSSLDFDLLLKHIRELKQGMDIQIPLYNFDTHTRSANSKTISWKNFVIIDGTLLLSQRALLPELNLKIFLDIPEKIRFERRLKRDVQERGRSPAGIKKQFEQQVKPMHDQFIEPCKKIADMSYCHGQNFEAFFKKILKKICEETI